LCFRDISPKNSFKPVLKAFILYFSVAMQDELEQIFKRISEFYAQPIKIGSQCEANTFYHIEDMTVGELEQASGYLTERIQEVCYPDLPSMVIHLSSCITDLPDLLAERLGPPGQALEVVNANKIGQGNGITQRLRSSRVIIANDVITTAKSCLELHARLTMLGANVVAWASLVDRTFGPGPVPVIAAHTGEAVRLLQNLS